MTGVQTCALPIYLSSSGVAAASSNHYWDNATGRLGIGTTSPDQPLTISSSTSTITKLISTGTGRASYINFTNSTDSRSAFVGQDGTGLFAFATGALAMGTNTDVPIIFAPNYTGGEKMRITGAGTVGIGTTSPVGGLHVRTTNQVSLYTEQYSGVGNQGSGIQCWNTNIFSPVLDNQMTCGWSSNRWTTVYATTGTINTSDSRQKMNISPSNLGLNFISNLNPVSYSWIDGGTPATEPNVVGARPGKRTFYGFLAQDVKKTLDATGTGDFAGWTLDDPKDPDSTQGLRYTEFIAPMVKAIKELSTENTALKDRLDSLESRLAAAGI